MMFQGDSRVIVGGDTCSIVLDLDSVEALIFEAHIFVLSVIVLYVVKTVRPIVVAPASKLFSTSSLTTEQL